MIDKNGIDASIMLEAACGDADIAEQLLALFFSQTESGLETLKDAVEQNESATAKKIAHKLVGSVIAAGLTDMAMGLRDLEHACDGELPTGMLARVLEMQCDLKEARHIFDEIMREERLRE